MANIYGTNCADLNACKQIIINFLREATTMKHKPIKLLIATYFGTFSTDLDRKSDEPIIVLYNFGQLAASSNEERTFFHNIHMRSAVVRGFAKITLTLLHELGHNETDAELPKDYDRNEAIKRMYKYAKTNTELDYLYYSLPDEWLATQWAIDWLSDENNRKIAKAFEKRFFQTWRGE